MKNRLMVVLFLIFVLIISGCSEAIESSSPTQTKSTTNDVHSEAEKNINISWQFEVKTSIDTNGVEVPKTNISVVIDERKIKIGEYFGNPSEITDFNNSHIPNDAIMACLTWFGGCGTRIYVKKDNDTTLTILYKNVEEGENNNEEFKKVLDINVPSTKNLKVSTKE